MKNNKKRGFTIIELVIVIAVVAILAGVLIPTFVSVINKAKLSADTQIVKNMNTALAAEEITSGKNVDAYKAYEVLKNAGFLAEKLNPTTEGYYYAFDAYNNRMLILDNNFDVYFPTEYKSLTMEENGDLWSIYVSSLSKEDELRAAFAKTGKAHLKASVVIPGTKLPSGVSESDFVSAKDAKDGQDVVQAIASIGNAKTNFTDAKSAISAINYSANGGTVYLPSNGSASIGGHLSVTKDIVIYANGADFGGNDIAINHYDAISENVLNVTVYDAKNFYVWGNVDAKGTGKTINIKLVNCTITSTTSNGLVYLNGSQNIVNLTIENCYVKGDGVATNGIYLNAGGTVSIINSTFENCAIGVAISNKMESGELTVNVENCYFNSCGTTSTKNDACLYAAPLRFVKKAAGGTITATFKNNTFTNTVGSNGDVLVGEYRQGEASNPITANIVSARSAITVCKVLDGAKSEQGTLKTITVNAGSGSVSVTCGTRN